jgi:GntR family transcriptional regulator
MQKGNQSTNGKRAGKQARYSELANQLRRGIASDTYPVGSRLPSEIEFAKVLGVSRSTLREALSLLEREGLISRKQRAGTRVRARPSVDHTLQRNYSVRELIESSGKQHGVIDAEIQFIAANPDVARDLDLEVGSPLVALERTRTADGKPLVRTIDYIDAEIVSRGTAPLLPDVSFYEWLHDHCGIAVTHAVAHLTTLNAPIEIAKLLDVERGSPLLRLSQIDYTAADEPVLRSEEFHIAEAFSITILRDGPYDPDGQVAPALAQLGASRS